METTNNFIKLGDYTLSCDSIKKAIYSIYDLSHEIKQLTIKTIPINELDSQLVILIELCHKNLCNCMMEKQVFYEFIRAMKKEGQYYREFFKELDTDLFPQIKLVFKPEGSL
jgi:hypothetical protein